MNTIIRQINENTLFLSVDYRDFWASYLKENGYRFVLWVNFDAYENIDKDDWNPVLVDINLRKLKNKLGIELEHREFNYLLHGNTIFFVYDTLELLWEAFNKVDDEDEFFFVLMIRDGEIVNENT